MKRTFTYAGLLAIMSLPLMGCSNTERGLQQDAAVNGPKIEKAAQNAELETKAAGKNVAAAVEVTPKVKDAIDGDSELKDNRNVINVSSANSTVHLTGHVYSSQMKARANNVTQKTLKDINATDTVSNELKVQK